MLYRKNKVELVGKVVYLGLKLEDLDLSILELIINNKQILVPIATKHLQAHLKLNTNVSVEGIIKSIGDIPYVHVNKFSIEKKRASHQYIELTGTIEEKKGADLYVFNTGTESVIVKLVIADRKVVKYNTVTNLKCLFRSPLVLDKNRLDLSSIKLHGINLTNL
ncbi:hypothetical protein [Clostridium tertium]|uniref:hypothetical protein n=1 Tax=Clostridium tertium TaxID=1559 RepID=UPI0023B25440|nr:hypothetical protein [Clostridium tertium]